LLICSAGKNVCGWHKAHMSCEMKNNFWKN